MGAQQIIERIQVNNNNVVNMQPNGAIMGSQIQQQTHHSNTANKKQSGKQSIGMSGRNRTATALLVASASASSEPLQESLNEGKMSEHKAYARKDYQVLASNGAIAIGKHHQNFVEGERTAKHMLVQQNILDRKARLKTSQGTKSGNATIGSKLP